MADTRPRPLYYGPAPLPAGAILRRAALLLIASLAFVLPPTVEDPVLKDTIPLFVLLLFLQMLPALAPRDTDIGAPPVFFGIGGIVAGLATAGSLAWFIAEGQISLLWVGALQPEEVEALVRKVLIACSAGTVAYYIGYYHPVWGPRLAERFPTVSGREWNVRRLQMVSVFMLLVFVACYAYFQSQMGGVSLLDVTQMGAGKAVFRQDPLLSWMTRGIYIGALPAFLAFAYVLQRQRQAPAGLVAVGLVIICFLTLRLGQRAVAFMAFMPAIIVYHFLRRKVPVSFLVISLLLAVGASNAMLAWRMDNQYVLEDGRSKVGLAEEAPSLVERGVTILRQNEEERRRFHVMTFLFNEFPANRNYLYGQSWLGMVMLPIPRWLFPDKWEYFIWRDTAIMLVLAGTPNPTPLLALLYINFSWVGMMVGLVLWGIFHRGIYDWVMRDSRDPTAVMLYAVVLVYFAPLLSGLSASMQYVLPVWLALRFIAPPGEHGGAPKPTLRARHELAG